jgi:hypothetical protein
MPRSDASFSEDLRPGAQVAENAIVLGMVDFRDRDRIVRLLTPKHGKISAVARNAVGSKTRFGGALEPAFFVTAQLRAPRDVHSSEAPLWGLDRVDLRDNFAHVRGSFGLLESALYAVAAVRDLVPDGPVDEELFRGLGRFLRALSHAQATASPESARIAFFSWFSGAVGFGNAAELLEKSSAEETRFAARALGEWLARRPGDFESYFGLLAQAAPVRFRRRDETDLYVRWTDVAGLRWPHFEKWTGLNS